MTIPFRKEMATLEPYKPGLFTEEVKRNYHLTQVIKLASNENPIGCSPKVLKAIKNAITTLNIYPDGNCTALKEALSKKFEINVSQILPSCGSDEMVDIISKAYIHAGDEVIMADITFPRYINTTKMMGGIPVIVPLKEFTYDLEKMAQAITSKTKIIWLCNPNNPTGTMFNEGELLNFLNKVPQNIMIVYDEAYNEFVTREDYPKNAYQFIHSFKNLVVMRTFSKIYGLASLRVGYTIANEEIIQTLNKVRNPFNVNAIAQIAAIAALEDDTFIQKVYNLNKEGKSYIYKEFHEMNIKYCPSETNHIFFNCGYNAQELFEALQKKGVIIRPIKGNYARVSIGTMEENMVFIETLKEVLNNLNVECC